MIQTPQEADDRRRSRVLVARLFAKPSHSFMNEWDITDWHEY